MLEEEKDAQGSPGVEEEAGASETQDNDPFEGIGQSPGVTGDDSQAKDEGQDDSQQEEEESQKEEPSKEAQPEEDNSEFKEGGKSYEELRKKLNDQGIEKNRFKEAAEESKSQIKQMSTELEQAKEELEAYKEWYSKYYPALNELWQDEEIRKKIEGSTPKGKSLSEKDVQKLLDEKLTEQKTQQEFEHSIDSWLDGHPDVKGQLAKDLYTYLEKHDLTPNPDILDMAYTYLTKDHLKEAGAKKKELEDSKIKKAAVGGGSGKGKVAPKKDTIDDLFATPTSQFYPNS